MPRFFADPADITPELAAARKAKYGGQGTGSLMVDFGVGLGGPDRKRRFLDRTYEGLTRPLMNADEHAGRAVAKRLPKWMQGLMTRKEMLPLPGKQGLHLARSTAALSEPLMKVKGVGVPLVAAMALGSMLGQGSQAAQPSDEELLRQLGYYYDDPAFQKAGAVMTDQNGLMKEAAVRIQTLVLQNQDAIEKLAAVEIEKSAHDVVWEMVERGHIKPPTSRTEFAEKVAMVATRGPELTRAALDFAPSLPDFMLDKAAGAGAQAEDPLTHFVHTGEI
jgi:hypothetical protein